MTGATTSLANLRKSVAGLRHASVRHAELIAKLAEAGFRQDAVAAMGTVDDLPAGRAEDHEALAYVAFTLADHAASLRHYSRVVQLAPEDPVAWYNLATSQRNVGQIEEAETAVSRAIALNPVYAQALLLRSHLRHQSPDNNHVGELRRILARLPARVPEAIFINYALGKELDDLGEYDAAFGHFAMGAAGRRETLHYDVGLDVQKLRRISAVFNAQALKPFGEPREPLRYGFIIGLPRSGTTLIERVLTGSPEVRSNGETDNLLGALMDGTPSAGSDIFERVANADSQLVTASYQRRAGEPPRGGILLEKLPLNYLYAGAIARTLPDAQMILLRRNPIDNGFAMYSTLFGAGYPFSYSLAELAVYLAEYGKLVDHWKSSLGRRLLEVAYDDFVLAPDDGGPPLAKHLGIDWHPAMVAVEKNSLATATESAVQVRRPIYRTASGRWRNYAKHLAPFSDALSKAGVV